MIHASMAEAGPETCLKFSTLRFLEKMSDLEDEAAIHHCEESTLDPFLEPPTKIDVSRIEVEGDSATALIAYKGSFYDGQKVRYAFVERDGRWKFNDLLGFVDLDAARLVLQAGRYGMLGAETPGEAKNIACWIGRMERMSDEELEDLLLGDGAESSNCTAESSSL